MALCTSSEEETRKVLSFSSQDPDSRHGRDSVLHREVYTAHQGAFLMESLEQASWRGSHTPGLAVLEAFEQCPQQRAVIPAAPSCSGSWTKCCRYLITEILHSIPFHAIPFHSVPFPAERDGPPCGATCWRTPLTSAVLESCGAHPEKHLGKNTWRTTRSDWPPSLAPRWALNQGIGSTLDSAKLSQLLLSAY